jgi:hypothetical protein
LGNGPIGIYFGEKFAGLTSDLVALVAGEGFQSGKPVGIILLKRSEKVESLLAGLGRSFLILEVAGEVGGSKGEFVLLNQSEKTGKELEGIVIVAIKEAGELLEEGGSELGWSAACGQRR